MITLYYGIQWLTSVLEVYPYLGLPDHLAQHGTWVQVTDHHFWQLVLALIAIFVLSRGHLGLWGFNLQNSDESLHITRRFCYYYGIYFVGVSILLQLFVIGPPPLDHPWLADHILGRLAFGFLFVGLSEEILFRGLIHSYLAKFWTGVWSWRGYKMPVAGIIAALIFTLAHIGLRLSPFTVAHFFLPQLVQAFVLGLFYSWAYHRTGRLLAPILTHNFSDGVLWLGEYLVIALT